VNLFGNAGAPATAADVTRADIGDLDGTRALTLRARRIRRPYPT
jgi:hypothetical protein